MNYYLIVLEGGGDIDVKIVDQQTYDWIESPRPSFVKDGGQYERNVPETIRERYRQTMKGSPYEKDDPYPYVTVGSCENDRALWAPALYDGDVLLQFGDVSEAVNWFVEKGVKSSGSWEGCIY